jgi:GPH family glycoside/pentoside/hexuronide:cation symporter
MPAETAGVILLATKLFDAITDPIVGSFSDRTVSRHGRRRPWMLGAAFPLAILNVFTYISWGISTELKIVYFLSIICAFKFAFSSFYVPYTSLTSA